MFWKGTHGVRRFFTVRYFIFDGLRFFLLLFLFFFQFFFLFPFYPFLLSSSSVSVTFIFLLSHHCHEIKTTRCKQIYQIKCFPSKLITKTRSECKNLRSVRIHHRKSS
ncbi:hypothetical protein AAZX31_15G186200 [Glycine max]